MAHEEAAARERDAAAGVRDIRESFDRAGAVDGRQAHPRREPHARRETVTLVAHDGRPVASRCVLERNGKAAATAALLPKRASCLV